MLTPSMTRIPRLYHCRVASDAAMQLVNSRLGIPGFSAASIPVQAPFAPRVHRGAPFLSPPIPSLAGVLVGFNASYQAPMLEAPVNSDSCLSPCTPKGVRFKPAHDPPPQNHIAPVNSHKTSALHPPSRTQMLARQARTKVPTALTMRCCLAKNTHFVAHVCSAVHVDIAVQPPPSTLPNCAAQASPSQPPPSSRPSPSTPPTTRSTPHTTPSSPPLSQSRAYYL